MDRENQEPTTSVLTTATDVLSVTTSDLMNLQLIVQQLSGTFELSVEFTPEMGKLWES